MEIKRINREEIKEKIKAKGYVGKLIEYQELQQLYKEYGRGMSEIDFAKIILGIEEWSYYRCKNGKNKAKILKEEQIKLSEEQIDEIKEKIREKGYTEKQIRYHELQELYKEYGKNMTEKEFVRKVLGVSEGLYYKCKNGKCEVEILKKEKIRLSEEEIRKIRFLLKEKGYTEKQITYQELQQLYREYGKGMLEKEFAVTILGISESAYYIFRNTEYKIKILSEKNIELLEKIKEIKQELRKKGYIGKVISYQELQELYKEYGKCMTEKQFAVDVLSISERSYYGNKKKKSRVKILNEKEIELSEEKIEEIKQELKENGYIGKFVEYQELQELYKEYGNGISEEEFAKIILGISKRAYHNCKNGKTRAKVFKEDKIVLTEDDINQIKLKLKEKGYMGKPISYQQFQKLCKKYGKGISEKDFAEIIFNMSEKSYYNNYKSDKLKNKILKEDTIELEEKNEKIRKKLKEKGYIGKTISYQELQELHIEFGKDMSEKEFAENILGISYSNYKKCKQNKINVIIKDPIVHDKVKEIKQLYTNAVGYYSKELVEDICREYDISINDFITYIVIGKHYDISPYKKVLEEKGKVWIGKTRVSKEFMDSNISLIEGIAKKVAKSLYYKYGRIVKKEDCKQDVIVYMIENMGAIEKNFGEYNEILEDLLYAISKKYCEIQVICELTISSKHKSLTKKKESEKNRDKPEFDIEDKNTNVEKVVIEKQECLKTESNKCIKLLSNYIEFGYSKTEAIEMTAIEMDIGAEEMLKYMQEYLIKNGKVKIRKNGKVEIAER